MEQIPEFDRILEWARGTAEWALGNLLNPWTAVQILLLVGIFLLVGILKRMVRQPLETGLARLKAPPPLRPLVEAVPRIVAPAIFVLAVWLVIGVMQQLTWPSNSYLLRVVASLLTAWVVIRLSSSFVRNAAASQALAVVVWAVAALNITGLLTPTVETLDAMAFEMGDLRISLLTVIKGLLVLVLLLWAAAILSRILEARIERLPDLTPSVRVLLAKLLKFSLFAFAVLIGLNSVGIDLSALAIFSGAVGLGVGFGLQKVVSNLFSGVILLLDKSIKPGDVIELGETFGWISSLSARYVSVVTRDGKEFLIPNEDLITQRVVNWSYTDQLVRMEIPIGVSYEADPHEVRKLVRKAAAAPERVTDDPAPVCHLAGFGDSSLDFLLRFWIRDPQNGVANVKGEVLLAVWDAFREHGIAIPYPHRELIVRDPVRVANAGRAAE